MSETLTSVTNQDKRRLCSAYQSVFPLLEVTQIIGSNVKRYENSPTLLFWADARIASAGYKLQPTRKREIHHLKPGIFDVCYGEILAKFIESSRRRYESDLFKVKSRSRNHSSHVQLSIDRRSDGVIVRLPGGICSKTVFLYHGHSLLCKFKSSAYSRVSRP